MVIEVAVDVRQRENQLRSLSPSHTHRQKKDVREGNVDTGYERAHSNTDDTFNESQGICHSTFKAFLLALCTCIVIEREES